MLIQEDGIDYYISKGKMIFKYSAKGNCLKSSIIEKETFLKPYNGDDFMNWFKKNGDDFMNWFKKNVDDLMCGKEFYKCVDDGVFIDYDGTLAEIYVDEYLTNLGLCHQGICQGNFLLDGDAFLILCKNHKVEVNWCNK